MTPVLSVLLNDSSKSFSNFSSISIRGELPVFNSSWLHVWHINGIRPSIIVFRISTKPGLFVESFISSFDPNLAGVFLVFEI